MRALLLTLLVAAASGCSTSPTLVDENFGQAVLRARAQQVVDPDAPSRRREPLGIDGQAAKAAVDRYEKSFENPPAPINVLNIGIGTGTSGGSTTTR